MAFPNNCNPRIINVSASTGCTLTRASIRGMTPQDFEDQGFKEVGMDRIITRSKEAKVAGVVENTLETLLMSRITPIKKGELGKVPIQNESAILPFIYRRQRRNINSNYWKVTAGAAAPDAGQGGIPVSAWDLTLTVTGSSYASSLVELERYFLPGKMLFVETVNATTKAAYSLQFKILRAVNADSGGVSRAKVTLEPNVSASGWSGYTSTQKAVFQPTAGTAFLGANAVSDYESWCYNEVAENTNKLLTFWLQTSRQTHEYNEEYLKALNHALMSGYWHDFRQLPLAKQKVLQRAQYAKSLINSAFYGQRINEFQTPETYQSLPTVKDPANANCTLEYKAHALGFKTQLQDCSRYLDHQGNALNLDFLASTGYDLKRSREATGGTVDTIDFMTDRFTAGAILDIMVSFYKAKYGVNIERFYQPDQALSFENQVMLKYNKYQLPPDLGGYELAIFTHPYFDDKLAAAAAGDQKSRARTLWGVDWSDVQLGIAGTSSVSRKTNEADNLYNCVIKPHVTHYQLESTTWSPILEDPSRHYIVDNFGDACPTLTVAGCTV